MGGKRKEKTEEEKLMTRLFDRKGNRHLGVRTIKIKEAQWSIRSNRQSCLYVEFEKPTIICGRKMWGFMVSNLDRNNPHFTLVLDQQSIPIKAKEKYKAIQIAKRLSSDSPKGE